MSDFERVVTDALRLFGWRFVHQRPAQTARGWRTALTGHQGFPDFVAVRGKRLLFIEVKGDHGYPNLDQHNWGQALLAAGAEYLVARPKDWDALKHTLAPEGVEVMG